MAALGLRDFRLAALIVLFSKLAAASVGGTNGLSQRLRAVSLTSGGMRIMQRSQHINQCIILNTFTIKQLYADDDG